MFPAFPGVREVILFTYVNLVKKNVLHSKHMEQKNPALSGERENQKEQLRITL